MIFQGEPNLLVRVVPPIGNIRHIRFNEEGHFTTENERLIKRLQHKFKTQEIEEAKEVKVFACKKCDFVTDNKGLLMAHYREHKKEESK